MPQLDYGLFKGQQEEEEEEENGVREEDDDDSPLEWSEDDEDGDDDTDDDDADEEDDDEDEEANNNNSTNKQTDVNHAPPAKSQPRVLSRKDQLELEGEHVSSDDDVEVNATGDVPLEWYTKTFDHIGYDRAGAKLVPKGDGDDVSRALLYRGESEASKEFRRSVYDAKNDETTVLTDRELTMVRRMLAGRFPHPEFNAEPEYVPYYSGVKFPTSLSAEHEPKRRFLPSKWERMKVEKIVRGIQEGRIKIKSKEEEEEELLGGGSGARKPYMLWGEDGAVEDEAEMLRRKRRTGGLVPAPKAAPPGHKESYHPPPEYLLTEEEASEARARNGEDEFVPQDVGVMRRVGAYPGFTKERFERCLDLYLCARSEKHKLNIDPESLVPRLPLPRELRPFPTTNAVQYLGHTGRVRALAVDPQGQFLATGGDDGDVRVWDVQSGRCVSIVSGGAASSSEGKALQPVIRLAWNPKFKGVVLAARESHFELLYLGVPYVGGLAESVQSDLERTVELLNGVKAEKDGSAADAQQQQRSSNFVWEANEDVAVSVDSLMSTGSVRVATLHLARGDTLVDMSWHAKGEFACTVATSSSAKAGRVAVHHVGRRRSQEVLRRVKGDPQCAVFHPDKPVLFVATKTHVVAYHLTKQETIKKLKAGVKWISSIAIHPKGDHVLVGSFDCRVVWFDLDLSSKPFKTMRYHQKAVRRVAFHRRYPLFSSASDDGTLNVFHATVYEEDYTRNPLIVPVKRIEAHDVVGGRGVLDAVFHPTQPWVFTAGADGLSVLFTNIP